MKKEFMTDDQFDIDIPADADSLLTNFSKSLRWKYEQAIVLCPRKIFEIRDEAFARDGTPLDYLNSLHLKCLRSEAGDCGDFWRIFEKL